MKNPNKKNPGQHALPLSITASVDEATFLKDLVEKLAYRKSEHGFNLNAMPCGQIALETSSLEAHISGSIEMVTDGEHFRVPYTTCFMFTCTKRTQKEYKLSWISSLS